jgi:hypothetical protein
MKIHIVELFDLLRIKYCIFWFYSVVEKARHLFIILEVQGSREAAINIGHVRKQSQESILIYNHLLIDLRNKATEV